MNAPYVPLTEIELCPSCTAGLKFDERTPPMVLGEDVRPARVRVMRGREQVTVYVAVRIVESARCDGCGRNASALFLHDIWGWDPD